MWDYTEFRPHYEPALMPTKKLPIKHAPCQPLLYSPNYIPALLQLPWILLLAPTTAVSG